jgi:hypothetical protein
VTFDDIEARIVEAAEIERRMPNHGERPIGYKGSWPVFMYDFADRVGWDEIRHKDDAAARSMVLCSVSRSDYDRWQEVRRWIIELLTDPPERRALSAWAISVAGGRPFSRWCRHVEHIARQTGYRRVSRAIERIGFALEPGITTGNSDMSLLQSGPQIGMEDGKMAERMSITSWMADDARPTEDIEARDLAWSQNQNARRAERERRRRAKMDAEAE